MAHPSEDFRAARPPGRAALSVLAGAGALLIAFHIAPHPLPWAVVGFDLALLAAGWAVTRRMAAGTAELGAVWAEALRWGLPALALVVAAVLGAGLFLLPPDALAREAALAGWTLTGFSGVELMGQGAYDPAVRDELLLPAWCLGVAAQLGLVWTLAMATLRGRRRALAVLALGGAAAAFVLNLWLLRTGREPYAFYLAPARAGPFLFGAFLALSAGGEIERAPIPAWLAGVGSRVLPVSLWFWPLLALPRAVLARPLGWGEMLAALAAAALLGEATHRWLERPLRSGAWGPRAGPAGLAAVGALLLASVALVRADGLPGRAGPRLNAEAAAVARPAPFQADCNAEDGRLSPAGPCTTPFGRPAQVIVWGDSHAAHLTPAVRAWAATQGLAVRQATHSGCPPLLRFSTGFEPRGCEAFNRAALAEWGRNPHANVILMGGGWTWALAGASDPERAPAALEGDIRASLRSVRAAVGPEPRIVLLGVTPDFAFAPARCHAQRAFLRLDTARCDRAAAANAEAAADMDARLARLAAAEPGVSLYRPWPVFCADGLCRTRGAAGPWYRDRTHLTETGGRVQTEALGAVLDGAMADR